MNYSPHETLNLTIYAKEESGLTMLHAFGVCETPTSRVCGGRF